MPSRWTRSWRSGSSTATRAGPGATCGTRRLRLFEIHYGEGAYRETEEAIQELLGVEQDLVDPVRPEDDPSAMLVVPTPEQQGAYSGPYEAGAVWAVLEGTGTIRVNGDDHDVTYTGAHELVEHDVHTEGVLALEIGDGVTLPRHHVHPRPGALSASGSTSVSSRLSTGGPVSFSSTTQPGQYGLERPRCRKIAS